VCGLLKPRSQERNTIVQTSRELSDLSDPQGILDLRRHLGELSRLQGLASKEALTLAQSMEKAMNFFRKVQSSHGAWGPDVWSLFNDDNETPFIFGAKGKSSQAIVRMIKKA
jgi:hypothetical protein